MYRYLLVILLVIILTSIETFALYNLKLFNNTNTFTNYLIGIIGYIIVGSLLAYIFSFEKIGIVNHLWNVFSSIFVFIVGYIYFSESMNTLQCVGVIFGFIGIILMGLDNYLNKKITP